MSGHDHKVDANTEECFTEFLHHKVIGVLFDAFPLDRGDLSASTKTLIFDCGCGLTISDAGTHWVESAENIKMAIRHLKKEVELSKNNLESLLKLAGELDNIK